jgi:hypothetical protein
MDKIIQIIKTITMSLMYGKDNFLKIPNYYIY